MADVHKLPEEQFMITGNFANVLRRDILDHSKSAAMAEDRNGVNATQEVLDLNSLIVVGGALRIRIRGGSFALSPYSVKLIAETLTGNRWVLPITLHIDEG